MPDVYSVDIQCINRFNNAAAIHKRRNTIHIRRIY